MMSGSYSVMRSPMAGLFHILWADGQGGFKPSTPLKGTDGKALIIPSTEKSQRRRKICTRPFAVDWDADGDLDLLVGNFEGTFYLFEGTGKGGFLPIPKLIKSGGEALKIKGMHSDPCVVDWDNDGDLDLLSGSTIGGVQWAENTAAAGMAPVLKKFVMLVPEQKNRGHSNKVSFVRTPPQSPAGSTRVWADDINGDGKLDLLVGDYVSISYPVKGMERDDFEKQQAQWKKEMTALQREMNESAKKGKGPNLEVSQKMTRHYAAREKFLDEKLTGYVWLYLRK